MARVPETSPKYRTKETIATDIATVLASGLSWGTAYAMLADAIWTWSEFRGKHHGCRYWSSNACRHRRSTKTLIHEHLVPKKVIIDLLRHMGAPSAPAVHDLLERLCVGVVVTREEDAALSAARLRSRMPHDWDGIDTWALYRAVGIEWEEKGAKRSCRPAGSAKIEPV